MDSQIAFKILEVFKYGIGFHMMNAFWVYSNPTFFPLSDFYYHIENGPWVLNNRLSLEARIFNIPLYTAFVLCIFAVWILDAYFLNFLKHFICCCFFRKSE